MASMREDFDSILRQWGYNIYLQRKITPFMGGRKDSDYRNELEKHTVRSRMAGSASSLAMDADEQTEGILVDSDVVFYFRHDVYPMAGDKVYESIERYPNDTVEYVIDTSFPMRGEKGKIIYWAVGATRENPPG